MDDLIKTYNPANAAALTPKQIAELQNLTSDQIKKLAVAYPNRTMNRAYLLIIDSKVDPAKQLPRLSTFENLWNLRELNAQRQFVAYNFKGVYRPNPVDSIYAKTSPKSRVLDLSETELMSLPGFKTAGGSAPALKSAEVKIQDKKITPNPQEVKVKRVYKKRVTQ